MGVQGGKMGVLRCYQTSTPTGDILGQVPVEPYISIQFANCYHDCVPLNCGLVRPKHDVAIY